MKYDAKIFKAVESDNLNYSDLESLDFMNIVFGRLCSAMCFYAYGNVLHRHLAFMF